MKTTLFLTIFLVSFNCLGKEALKAFTQFYFYPHLVLNSECKTLRGNMFNKDLQYLVQLYKVRRGVKTIAQFQQRVCRKDKTHSFCTQKLPPDNQAAINDLYSPLIKDLDLEAIRQLALDIGLRGLPVEDTHIAHDYKLGRMKEEDLYNAYELIIALRTREYVQERSEPMMNKILGKYELFLDEIDKTNFSFSQFLKEEGRDLIDVQLDCKATYEDIDQSTQHYAMNALKEISQLTGKSLSAVFEKFCSSSKRKTICERKSIKDAVYSH